MSFLKNTWYVAAWASEIESGVLFKRTILQQNLLFLRSDDGRVAALDDRCAHRQVPLSMGKVIEGCIECPYHGLQYNVDGQCVHNPHGNGRIPSRAVIKTYPVEERYGAVWIWMGDQQKANVELIPCFDFMSPEVAYLGEGKMTIEGDYQLETDNILDLSHIEFVHPVFSSPAVSRAGVSTEIDGNTVWSKRDIDNDLTPPDFIRQNFQVQEGPIDRWLHVHWQAPACMAVLLRVSQKSRALCRLKCTGLLLRLQLQVIIFMVPEYLKVSAPMLK